MPKELTHFLIAEKTAACLKQDGIQLPSGYEDALLCGSIFHDTLYYLIGPVEKAVRNLPFQLHGSSPFIDCIRLQAELLKKHPADHEKKALLAGMISHGFADQVIHPMVEYLTGNCEDTNPQKKAIAHERHRALESVMDIVLASDRIKNHRYAIARIVGPNRDRFEQSLPIHQLAEAMSIQSRATTPEYLSKCIRRSWKGFSALQKLSASRIASLMAYVCWPVLPHAVRGIASLFYLPGLTWRDMNADETMDYRHPVTGEAFSASLNQLTEKAARQAANYYTQVMSYVQGTAPYPDGVPIPGASVNRTPEFYANPPYGIFD